MRTILFLITKYVKLSTTQYNITNIVDKLWVDMSSKERVKILLAKEDLTLKELASKLSQKMNRKIPLQTLSSKLSRNSLKLQEFEYIAEILGYEIEVKKVDSN